MEQKGIIYSKELGYFTFDIIVNETHNYSNSITKLVVENGRTINDHMTSQPDKVTMSCVITDENINTNNIATYKQTSYDIIKNYNKVTTLPFKNTKLGAVISKNLNYIEGLLANVNSVYNRFTNNGGLIKEKLDKLYLLSKQSTLIKLITHTKIYDSMVITNITINHTSNNKAQVTLTFDKFRTVNSTYIPGITGQFKLINNNNNVNTNNNMGINNFNLTGNNSQVEEAMGKVEKSETLRDIMKRKTEENNRTSDNIAKQLSNKLNK